ncbi:hypothetical protein DLM86_02550 [Paenibacillus flagellatus]|uniref:Spore germination protein n=2 Tax=Paenibacillus flagellatus TaxID=2211139 RepID=A0A2V5KEM4_9BACL|nr:hypothetical protein DLM86_02550 [Paenibacillus flagellatus]
MLDALYQDCSDIVIRRFRIGGVTDAVLVYIEGLSDTGLIDQHILAPLMRTDAADADKNGDKGRTVPVDETASVAQTSGVRTMAELNSQIFDGSPVVLVDHSDAGTAFGLAKWEKRSVEEPMAESVVRGPREGFTETIRVNTSMLRRRIKSYRLKLKTIQIGAYTQTKVALAYVDGIAEPALIAEVSARIERIEIDGILESNYIEELIEDNPFSPFPQLSTTERPDVATAALLEGRVLVMVDGSPFVLIAPTTFTTILQSPEDYYQRFLIGSVIRWLRYFFVLVALLAPSLYVAVVTFHQEMIPSRLLLTLVRSREEIPFPALAEAMLMEITFEGLREAGVRLPKQVGAAVSIVGALVIGQAATAAGLVSSPMVMVVAITGIASFLLPQYSGGIALRMLRFPIMLLSGFLGLLGLTLGFILIYVHLCSLRSFGVPYLSPVAPLSGSELKDVLIRAPHWMMRSRPSLYVKRNKRRLPAGQKPEPPKGEERM